MSCKATAWAISQRYVASPQEKLIAIILGDVAGGDREDEVTLNIEYLVSTSCMSEGDVKQTLRKMIADEVLASTGETINSRPVYRMVRVCKEMDYV